MLAVPNDAAPYNNLCVVNQELGNVEVARKYAEAALRIDPAYPNSCHMLGVILIERDPQNKQVIAKCLDLWLRGLESKGDTVDRSSCADDLATTMMIQKNWPAAGYMVQWWESLANDADPAKKETVSQFAGRVIGNVIGKEDPKRAKRLKILNELQQKMPQAELDALRAKTSGFSRGQFESLAAGKPLASVLTVAAAAAAVPNAGTPVTSGGSMLGRMSIGKDDVDAFLKIAREKAQAGVEVPADGLTKPLPGKPDEIIMGYAGTCLLMRFPELQRLGVFDLCQAKFIKYIDLKERDAVFAAGGKVLLIYSPSQNQIEKWDMVSWMSAGVMKLSPEERITAMGMGLLNPWFALVVRGEENGMTSDKLAILNLSNSKFAVPNCVQSPSTDLPIGHFFGHMGKSSKVYVEESGTAALVTGGGRGFMKLTIPTSIETSYIHMGSTVDAAVTLGGSHVVIQGREVYMAEEKEGLLQKIDKMSGKPVARFKVANVAGFRGIAEIIRQGDQTLLQLRALPQLIESRIIE